MSWRRMNVADGAQGPSQVGCCQPGMQVSDPLAIGVPFQHLVQIIPCNLRTVTF